LKTPDVNKQNHGRRKQNTDHHNGDLNVRFFVDVVSFTHFKWLNF